MKAVATEATIVPPSTAIALAFSDVKRTVVETSYRHPRSFTSTSEHSPLVCAFYKVMSLRITKKYPLRKVDSSVELTERLPLLMEKGQCGPFSISGPAPTKWFVLKKVWHLEGLILMVLFASLSVWPPLVTEIKAYNFPSLQESGGWSLILLTLCSISDCVARFIVNHRYGLTPSNVWTLIMARFVFVPIIIGVVKEWWLQSEIWSMLNVQVLGFGNGYPGTLTIIFVSESVHTDEQHLTGPFTSFSLISGLVPGSTVGLILEKVVLDHYNRELKMQNTLRGISWPCGSVSFELMFCLFGSLLFDFLRRDWLRLESARLRSIGHGHFPKANRNGFYIYWTS